MLLARTVRLIVRSPCVPMASRLLHITPVSQMRKLKQYTDGDLNIVEAEKISPPASQCKIEPPDEAKESSACSICRLGLKRLLYTDVLILSQFMDKNWRLMALEDTQLCLASYMKVKRCVEKAQKCKLLPRPADYKVYGLWDRLNTYHEWPSRRRDDEMRVVKKETWSPSDQ